VSLIKITTRSQSRSSFIERTLIDINNTMEQSVFAEKMSQRSGLLQIVDPRIKIIVMIAFLLAVGFSRQLIILAILYLFTFILAILSAVPLGFYLKRVWGFVLLFTGIIALPALFITPGPVFYTLPLGIEITSTGAQTALFLLLRVGTSVSFTILVILSTPWNSLLKALGVLHIPDVIVLVMGMTYRYIHLFLHMTDEMFLSRKSRTLRRLSRTEERRLIAETTGNLLGKSLQLSSEVYLAMESRGYRGYPKTIDQFQVRWFDWCFVIVMAIITGASIWFGR
jgi:cobalt/nickel transport system permease protein